MYDYWLFYIFCIITDSTLMELMQCNVCPQVQFTYHSSLYIYSHFASTAASLPFPSIVDSLLIAAASLPVSKEIAYTNRFQSLFWCNFLGAVLGHELFISTMEWHNGNKGWIMTTVHVLALYYRVLKLRKSLLTSCSFIELFLHCISKFL